MTISLRWNVRDLDVFPEDGKLREVIDGELYVSTQPHWYHQRTCSRFATALESWSIETGTGEASVSPGVIFSDEDAVAPDVVWVSAERVRHLVNDRGKLRAAPELVVEVLSPGAANEARDREAKLRLYSRWGVREYWIVSWELAEVQVYRRADAALAIAATLTADDILTSPLLPAFSARVGSLVVRPPAAE